MPSLKNLVRRDPERPTLKERAAALRAKAARVMRRPAAAPAPMVASDPNQRLVAMVEEWAVLQAQINGDDLDDDAVDSVSARHCDLQREICLFPAASVADLAAKILIYRNELESVGTSHVGQNIAETLSGAAWTGLIRDLARLAGNTGEAALMASRETTAKPATIENVAELDFQAYSFDDPLQSPLAWREKLGPHALALHLAERLLRMDKPQTVSFVRGLVASDLLDPLSRSLADAQESFKGWSDLADVAQTRLLVAASVVALEPEA